MSQEITKKKEPKKKSQTAAAAVCLESGDRTGLAATLQAIILKDPGGSLFGADVDPFSTPITSWHSTTELRPHAYLTPLSRVTPNRQDVSSALDTLQVLFVTSHYLRTASKPPDRGAGFTDDGIYVRYVRQRVTPSDPDLEADRNFHPRILRLRFQRHGQTVPDSFPTRCTT